MSIRDTAIVGWKVAIGEHDEALTFEERLDLSEQVAIHEYTTRKSNGCEACRLACKHAHIADELHDCIVETL